MIDVLETVLMVFLGFNVAYILIYAIAGHFHKIEVFPKAKRLANVLVVIPAYKDDAVIVNSALRNRDQEYLKSKLDILVIGDHLKEETYLSLEMNNIKSCKLNLATSTKAKAINTALSTIKKDYDLVVILDANNHLSKGAIKKINRAYQQGHQFIQCHRTTKNENNEIEILGVINDEVNNHIFRKGHQALHVSSALVGSGMAFGFKAYKNLMLELDDGLVDGKVLELKLLQMRKSAIYMGDVNVYDEKVLELEHFEKKRSRWMFTQWNQFSDTISELPLAFITLNWHYMDRILQTFVMPRSLMLCALVVSAVVHTFTPVWYVWDILLVSLIVALFISIPLRFYKLRYLKLVLSLPRVFLGLVTAMFSFKHNEVFSQSSRQEEVIS